MKKVLLIIVLFIGVNSFAQKLEVNKTDEFTGDILKKTSWENLATSGFFTYFNVSNVNGDYFLNLKVMIEGKVFSIEKDGELMLKLTNGEIITLKNTEHTITCIGCGAKGVVGSADEGISVSYTLSKEDAEILNNATIESLRIYTSIGFRDSKLKEKNSNKIQKAIQLTS